MNIPGRIRRARPDYQEKTWPVTYGGHSEVGRSNAWVPSGAPVDFSDVDRAPAQPLDEILWKSVRARTRPCHRRSDGIRLAGVGTREARRLLTQFLARIADLS
jgi:hypothetical protein